VGEKSFVPDSWADGFSLDVVSAAIFDSALEHEGADGVVFADLGAIGVVVAVIVFGEATAGEAADAVFFVWDGIESGEFGVVLDGGFEFFFCVYGDSVFD